MNGWVWGVIGNLVADAIGLPIAFIWHHRHLRKTLHEHHHTMIKEIREAAWVTPPSNTSKNT